MALMQLKPDEIDDFITKLQVTVVGIGRIGLPTAVTFAMNGANVTGLDINPKLVKQIQGGTCPIDEVGLPERMQEVQSKGRLKVTANAAEALKNADLIIVSVPTPVTSARVPDYTNITTACQEIGKHLEKGSIVIIESTVAPGTVESLITPILETKSKLKASVDFGIGSCPERADPGKILQDLGAIPRVVGCLSAKTTSLVAKIYQNIFKVEVIEMADPKSANAVKLTENIFRDINIAFVNELALLYERLGIDFLKVIEAAASKYNYLPHYPGAGVGGPCLPANSYYVIEEGLKVGYVPYLIRMAREINDRMPSHMIELTTQALNRVGKAIQGSKVAVLGISYKPNVKDLQFSPSLPILSSLKSLGAEIQLFDPHYIGETIADIQVLESLENALNGADCVMLVTAHDIFKKMRLSWAQQLTANPLVIVDGRNMIQPEQMPSGAFLVGVGRPLYQIK